MTFFETLQAAGLPVLSADESGTVTMGNMTQEQEQTFNDACLQYFHPVEYAELVQYRADKQVIRDAYSTMITRLEQIQSVSSPTNAQVIQAIKDEALYIERIMKFLKVMLV
jgi:hypothetical protein